MPESSELSLLQTALSAAVPMRIAELRRRPLAEILDPEALRSIQTRLGEGGTFEASLELKFPEGGISNAAGLLEQASRNAGDGIELVAKFEMEENQP